MNAEETSCSSSSTEEMDRKEERRTEKDQSLQSIQHTSLVSSVRG